MIHREARDEMDAKLKYPILLVHGMGWRDGKRFGYWGRIPNTLEQAGNSVFFGNQDANADVETNGKYLAERIDEILAQTGAEKVNVIAHSKGGLDSRYAISKCGMGSKVASLTTVCTPHHGSKTVDRLVRCPDWIIRFFCFWADAWFRFLGDRNPRTYRVILSFTTDAARRFNEETPDHKDVYYQSYAFIMKKWNSDGLLWLPNLFVKRIEGENDGLLPPDAVRWGNYRGAYCGVRRRGISHLDEVDFRRKPFSKHRGEGVNDIAEFYEQICEDLKQSGF